MQRLPLKDNILQRTPNEIHYPYLMDHFGRKGKIRQKKEGENVLVMRYKKH